MKRAPAISVVIPAYNEEELLGRCLTSLTQQIFSLPYEIIVVNNNSTDRTEEIARSFGVRVIFEEKRGVVFTRQKGLISAKGDIIAGADADCIYPPHWLQMIYNHFKDKRVVAVGGPPTADKNPYWSYLIYTYGGKLFSFIYLLTGFVVYITAFNLSYRKNTFLKLGGYHTYLELGGGDELDPLARLKKAGKVIYDKKLIVHHSSRRHREGLFKAIFVHFLYYYLVGYYVARILKRPVIQPSTVRNI